MKLTFIGAAHEVTGSCTLLECCGGCFLIDPSSEKEIDAFLRKMLGLNTGGLYGKHV